MANLIVSDEIAERLKQIAEQEHKPVDTVLEKMIECYTPEISEEAQVTSTFKFNRQYEVGSPQATEYGIATLYRALEDYKRKYNAEV
jgi:hypothetical protein